MKPDAYLNGQESAPPGINRVAAGIALSIAVHGALLFALRFHAPVPKSDGVAPRETLVLFLRAPPPPPPVPVAAAVAPQPKARVAARAAPAGKRARNPAPAVIALPDEAPASSAPPERFSAAPAEEGPVFDPDAARKFARSIAGKPDPARAGMAVAQFPDKSLELEAETRLARKIGSAKRANCKDGLPGGLLGPILILFDKKDSGCKW